jgi:hypothetical protein
MVNEDKTKVTSKKKKKKRLFKLAAMEELVERNQYLQSKYDALSVNAEDKLGYHYNEVIHNILFNKYVKSDEDLMKQYYQIKKEIDIDQSREKGSKGSNPGEHPSAPEDLKKLAEPKPAAPSTPAAPAEPDNSFDPNAPIDTRLDEMTTGDAGSYSYETPFFLFAGTQEELAKKWKANNKKAQNNMKIIIPNTEQHTMGKNSYKELKEELFTNFEMAGDIFEEMIKEDKLPDALIRVKSVQKETEKDSLGYYKQVKNDSTEGKDNVATGLNPSSDSLSSEEVVKYVPSEEEEEFVKLNRGGNLMDRALQGFETEPSKEQMDKYRDQAGDQIVDDALAKKAEVDKLKPGAIPPAKVAIAESVVLNGTYIDRFNKKNTVLIKTNTLKESKEVTEQMAKINTLGMGNSYNEISENLTESYGFYIDLECGEMYKVKKSSTLNESAGANAKNDLGKMKHYFSYSPRKYERGK